MSTTGIIWPGGLEMTEYNDKQFTELFHLLFLDYFGRKMNKQHYVLKGGCNLSFFMKSFRYSEDMDLDVRTIQKDRLEDIVSGILHF